MRNKDKKQVGMSFIGSKSASESSIKDIIKDTMSFINTIIDIPYTWPYTWSACAGMLSRHNFTKLVRCPNDNLDIDADIDRLSMFAVVFSQKSSIMDIHIDIVCMMKTNAWPNYPCLKY